MSQIKTTKNFRKNLKKVKNRRPGVKGGIYLSNIPLVQFKSKKDKKNVNNNNN